MDQNSNDRKPRTTTADRRTAMRVMNRKSVGMVAVYEQDPTVATAGTRTLIFETRTFCTKVTEFPQDWQRLSDEELTAMRKGG